MNDIERLNGNQNGTGEVKQGRVLVIGLDGATFDLIKPWVEEGHLPTLGRLLQGGAHGELRSTVPPMTAPAWTSFGTGVNPGKHRLYDWVARENDSYRFTPVTALDNKASTIYSLLSEVGRQVCVMNVPMTYPPVQVNGVMISGIPAPEASSAVTYPETLYDEIIENVGDYILYPDPGQAYSDQGIDAFLERLYRATELRVQTLEYLQTRSDWDFTMLVFNGTDTVSHAMWKFMDRSHPLHDPTKFEKYGHAIRDYYKFVDQKLAGIVEAMDEDTTLIIMSDHGFGPFHKFIHVNNWLMDQGFMAVKPGLVPNAKRLAFRAGFSPMNVYDKMMKFGLGGMKKEVVRGGQGQDLMKRLFLSFEDIDWSRTQAYSLGNVGQVCINVIGREPNGCVQPGDEYERVRDDIIARLYELRDPETGEQVVEQVYRREEIYSGDYLEKAPDIVFIPRRLEYFGFGEYEFGSHQIIEPMRRGISGTHRMNGIFMAYGNKIQAGVKVEDASLVDLAPTILRLMDEPSVESMDGRKLHEIAAAGYDMTAEIAPRPERTAPKNGNDGGDGAISGNVLSDEEQKVLADRLRSLGYVG